MKIDVLYLALLGAYFATTSALLSFGIGREFIASYAPWIWAAYSGTASFLYGLLRSGPSRPAAITYFCRLARGLLLFCVSIVGAVAIEFWLHPKDQSEWPLAVFFLLVPAAFYVAGGLLFGFIIRSLRRHAI